MRGAPRHPMNAAVHHKLTSMMRQATIRHAYSELQAIKKAISSVERCPVPLFCAWQLSSLEGFGPKLTAAAEKVIKEVYAEYLDPDYEKMKAQQESENMKEVLTAQNEKELSKKLVKVRPADSQEFQYKRSCPNEPRLFSKGSWILVALFEADSIVENIREPIYRDIQDVLDVLEKKAWAKKSKEKEFKKVLLGLIKHRFVGVDPAEADKFTLTDNGRQIGKYHHYLVNNRNKIDLSEISVKDEYSQESVASRSASSNWGQGQIVSRNFIKDDQLISRSMQESNSYYSFNSEKDEKEESNFRFQPSEDLETLLNCEELADFIFSADPQKSKSPHNLLHSSSSFTPFPAHSQRHIPNSALTPPSSQSSMKTSKSLKSLLIKQKPPFRSLRQNTQIESASFNSIETRRRDVTKFTVILMIDNREKKRSADSAVAGNYFKDKLATYGVKSETCNLPVGDFLWIMEVTGMQIFTQISKARHRDTCLTIS